jgi:hypothetical protein
MLFVWFCLGTDHLTRSVCGGGGGYGLLFRSEICLRTTRQELEYFYLSREARNIFQTITTPPPTYTSS